MSYPAKAERNAEIVAGFRDGATMNELARKHGVSHATIHRVLRRADALGTPEERRARIRLHSQRVANDPDVKARKAAKMREHHAAGRIGRKAVIFAHDPVKRADYLLLRSVAGAAYARQAMGLVA